MSGLVVKVVGVSGTRATLRPVRNGVYTFSLPRQSKLFNGKRAVKDQVYRLTATLVKAPQRAPVKHARKRR